LAHPEAHREPKEEAAMRSYPLLRVGPAIALVVLSSLPASAFTPAIQRCRSSVANAAAKMTRTSLKAFASCSKERAKDGAFVDDDCTDLDQADLRGKVADKEEDFEEVLTGAKSKCTGIAPADALYAQCPPPCNDAVPAVTTFTNVYDCMLCLERAYLADLTAEVFGTPATPLAKIDARCQNSITRSSARLVNSVVKDVIRCELRAEKEGGAAIGTCTDTGFPSDVVTNIGTGITEVVNETCLPADFGNLDSCDTATPGEGTCLTDRSTATGQLLATYYLQLSSLCGDGAIQSPEQCDDGGESATCDNDCTFVVCGDHRVNVTAGEQCDSSQCCIACQFAAEGTPCNDNSICTSPDACNATGSCIGPAAPDLDCEMAGPRDSQLVLKNKTKQRKDRMQWNWNRGPDAPSFTDFPIASPYTLCVYRNIDATPSTLRTIRFSTNSRKWKNVNDRKYRYEDKSKYPDGVRSAKLQPGALHRSKIKVNVKGKRLNFTNLTTQFIPSIGLQLRNATTCYGATFSGPFSNAERFSGRND
jgi:hypothetical protein